LFNIQLPDKAGFDVLRKVQEEPAVIFTTAFEQYAINAFDEPAIDYLLKPIREERFAQSIEKLNRFGQIIDCLILKNWRLFGH
jgi:two-component system, LytTR family, response regulator